MAGTLTDLTVAGQLAARIIGRRLRSEIESAPDLDGFSAGMKKLLDRGGATQVAESKWLTMSATQPPWIDGGITLKPGDAVSYFIDGRVYANKFLDIWISPALQVWAKQGEQGEVFRGTRSSHSFNAQNSGPLNFGNYFPNDWADIQGARQHGDEIYKEVSGQVNILIIRWTNTAIEGLKTLLKHGDYENRLQNEIDRIELGDTTPPGWHYLWHLGPAEIYRSGQTQDGKPCIHCHTQADVGILQFDADMPLERGTEISWRWRTDQLPSSLREDTLPSHDYMSLAVEFDNGRDITYYWSSTLPVGEGYDCPLPNWQGKEFHVVVRSGTQGLGEWLNEKRNVYSDYQHYMGDPPPRIKRVWLIANSIFQRETGLCDYSDIALSNSQTTIQVL